jgi:acetyl esterase
MIDPVLQQLMDAMAASGFALPDPITPVSLRAVLDAPFPVEPIAIAEVRDVQVAGGDGPIPARLYHPKPGETLPVTVLIHGGGWVVGTLDTHDGLARVLARETGCAILSLGYRLAPEHPYPAPLDDCLAAIAELPSRAAEFGVRAEGYAVAGDSAGGNLAAAVALALAGKPNAPVHQLLFYPAVDTRFDTPSYLAAPDEGMLTIGMMRWFWAQYIGDAEPDALAAPLRAASLAGLAPATVIVAGNDPLHDEGFAYAVKLREAGVPTDLHSFSGAIHGFASFFGIAPIADQAIALAAGSLRAAFQRH